MIRFYINGTVGAKDGTEVTADNPITADGMYPSGSTAASKSIKVCIRADEGESYSQVMVGPSFANTGKCIITAYSAGTKTQRIYSRSDNVFLVPMIKTVADTNREFTLTFYANASESGTVDTSIVLFAYVVNLAAALDAGV